MPRARFKKGYSWSPLKGFHKIEKVKFKEEMSTPPKPTTRVSPEAAALNDLLKTMNNPDIFGVQVPAGIDPNAPVREVISPQAPTPEVSLPAQLGEATPAPSAPLITTNPRVTKLFFTGRLKSGKDFAAAASSALIFGFADPLYAIASHYYGITVNSTEGKDLPGCREILQIIGQWGRGTLNEKYPLTIPRALFLDRVRDDGANGAFGFSEVDWASFGHNSDIWLNACIARADEFLKNNPEARVAVTNCRFDNEFKRLQAEGFQHWHVMCSAKTWTERLAKSKLTPDSPAVKDTSEHLAGNLDQNVIKQFSGQKVGPQLRCIWSDIIAPKPSNRLHTVESFLKSIGG